jgi:NAD(P)-dependent dehydrogenase (short-subunit alcohol dehydrogenase family)
MSRQAARRVVVTGGTSGIGAATSRRFIADGHRVVALGYGQHEIDRAPVEVPGLAAAIRMDVADPDQVAAAFADVDRELGGVDVLIDNAGISVRHAFLDITIEEWQRVLAVNLTGMFLCAQQAARRMVAGDGGTILMTASTNGTVGHPNYADYNASKAGVIMLAKTMALELAPRVRVNCISPGYVMTPMQAAEYTPEMLVATDAKIPLGRHATPDEIAGLFAWLASDDAGYLTGAVITIDGGETAGGLASR